MGKKAFIHAYMAGNLGDDLMVRILCERYPDVKFLLYADSVYKERYKDLNNLKIYSPNDKVSKLIEKIVAKIKKTGNGMWKTLVKLSDVTVHIGGSVFVQHLDNFRPAYDLDYDLRQRSKKMYVVGANFGPYTDDHYYEAYKELFKSYNGICFRDQYSKGLFEKYENIKYAPDVVFNYQLPKNVKEEKSVLFSVISMEERGGKYSICQYADEYYRTIARMAEQFAERGYGIKMVSFCKMQGDENAIEKIKSRMDGKYQNTVKSIYYDKDITAITTEFASAEIIVGTRFHSIILGWLAGKKVLPIVYDAKIIHTLEDNNCELYIKMNELPKMNEDEITCKINKLMSGEVFDASKLIKEADLQFEFLDREFSR